MHCWALIQTHLLWQSAVNNPPLIYVLSLQIAVRRQQAPLPYPCDIIACHPATDFRLERPANQFLHRRQRQDENNADTEEEVISCQGIGLQLHLQRPAQDYSFPMSSFQTCGLAAI
jgi:hypothetical protein